MNLGAQAVSWLVECFSCIYEALGLIPSAV